MSRLWFDSIDRLNRSQCSLAGCSNGRCLVLVTVIWFSRRSSGSGDGRLVLITVLCWLPFWCLPKQGGCKEGRAKVAFRCTRGMQRHVQRLSGIQRGPDGTQDNLDDQENQSPARSLLGALQDFNTLIVINTIIVTILILQP